MTILRKSFAILAFSALAACSGNGPGGLFGGSGNGANGSDVSGANMGAIDATSLSYFQETIGDTVLFTVDQSTLNPEAITILTGQADWLRANPTVTILIEGHADERGTRDYNFALGSKRAAAVRDFLVSQGISTTRISVTSYGKERPLAICSNDECWNKNRRAVTVVTGGAGV